MPKTKEIHCCIACGRDTTRDCQVCIHCMPIQHNPNISRREEQVGRSAMSPDRLFGDSENVNDDELQLRHDLE